MPTANLQWIQYTETSHVSGPYKDAAMMPLLHRRSSEKFQEIKDKWNAVNKSKTQAE